MLCFIAYQLYQVGNWTHDIELQKMIWTKDINGEIVGIEMVYNNRKLNEISKGESVEKRVSA